MRTAKGGAPKNEQPSYEGREGGGVEINKNKRRTSIDRSTKATLILTVHCLIAKSSTNDLS